MIDVVPMFAPMSIIAPLRMNGRVCSTSPIGSSPRKTRSESVPFVRASRGIHQETLWMRTRSASTSSGGGFDSARRGRRSAIAARAAARCATATVRCPRRTRRCVQSIAALNSEDISGNDYNLRLSHTLGLKKDLSHDSIRTNSHVRVGLTLRIISPAHIGLVPRFSTRPL